MDARVLRRDQQSSYVAIELKADEVKRDAIAQVLGYVGRLRSPCNTNGCRALTAKPPRLSSLSSAASVPLSLIERHGVQLLRGSTSQHCF
jgi:hypothetical protein